MASIPLPALGVRTEQPESPLDQYSKIASLKAMMGQQQIQQQQIKAGDIDLQLKQQQQKDQQTVMQTLHAHGGNLQSALPELAGKINPQTYISLDKYNLEKQKDYAEIDSKTLATKQYANSQLLQLIDGASKLPPDQYAQQYPQIAAAAKQIKPDLKLDPAQMIPQEQLPQLGLGLQTEAQYLAQAKATREQQDFLDKRPGVVAKSQQDVKTNAGTSATGITAEQQAKLKGEAQARFEAARHNKVSEANQNIFGSIPTEDGTTGKDLLKKLAPPQQAFIKGMLDYTIDPKTLSNRGPSRYQAIALAKQIDPNFDESQYQTRYNLKKSFTSGPYSQQLNAINTAREHMQTFTKLADALHNKDTQLLNTVGNALSVQFGNDQVTNFNIAKNAFSGEVGKAFAGANVTQGDRQEVEHQIQAAQSPAQLRGAAATADKLLEGKQIALKKTFDDGMRGSPNFGKQEEAAQSAGATHAVKDASGKVIGYTADGKTMIPVNK